ERAMDRAEPREHPLDRLLADGHHDGREDALGRDRRRGAAGRLEAGDRGAVPAADEGDEAEPRAPGTDRERPERGPRASTASAPRAPARGARRRSHRGRPPAGARSRDALPERAGAARAASPTARLPPAPTAA